MALWTAVVAGFYGFVLIPYFRGESDACPNLAS